MASEEPVGEGVEHVLLVGVGRVEGHGRAAQLLADAPDADAADAATRLAETWIHTGDVAGSWPATDGLEHVSRLAWRTLPYALAGGGHAPAGPVAFELDGPGGERWTLATEEAPVTTIRGSALDLCLVAARRADPAATELTGEGPDAEAVLALVRTYA